MARSTTGHSLGRDNGSWNRRKQSNTLRTQHSKSKQSNHPLGAHPNSGVDSKNFFGGIVASSKENVVEHRPILAGVTVHFRDADGFKREGTVIRSLLGIGYSIMPTMGRRTIVPAERLLLE